jgi:hypothetical protein
MFKKIILFSLILIFNIHLFGGGNVLLKNGKSSFKSGEELLYMFSYGFIHGGSASIKLYSSQLNQTPVFHAKLVAKTIGITDKIYRIEDTYESYFDTSTCLPYKSIRDIKEGSYRYYNEVFFSQQDCTLISQKSGKAKVPAYIHDILSSLFYLRRMNIDKFNKGEVINITTYFGDEVFPFPLRYRGKEIVDTKIGKMECYRFDPVVEVGRVFESEDDMTFWITADQNQIPIKIKMKLIVGSVYCDLIEYKNIVQAFKIIK